MMDRGEKRETKDLRRRSECYTMRQKMADSDRAEGGIKGTSPRLRLGGISPNEGNSWSQPGGSIRCFTRNCSLDYWVGLMNEM